MLPELGQSTGWWPNAKINRGRSANVLAVLHPIVCVLLLLSAESALGQDRLAVASDPHGTPPTLVIGFMGGFVHSDDLRHSEAQLAQRLDKSYGDRVLVEMFENRQRARARDSIIDWLTRLEAARVPGEEKVEPRIILFGHSWGASVRFKSAKNSAAISVVCIENVVTGRDSERVLRGPVGTLSRLAPYGGGKALSLMRMKLDTLTIEYRDSNGGLHGAIFTMHPGDAEAVKQALLAQGARTSIPSTIGSASSARPQPEEKE